MERGLLGFVLAGLAVVLLIYWLKELRVVIRKDAQLPLVAKQKHWMYDIIDHPEGFTFVAEVPGPEDKVSVEVTEKTLKIKSGSSFRREVKLPNPAVIVDSKYVNGVLNIRLKKVQG